MYWRGDADMGILNWFGSHESDEDMARTNKKPLDADKIDEMVRLLRAASKSTDEFREVQANLAEDKDLSAQEVIAIAQAFVGGVKLKSRKAALTAIGQERLRVSHSNAKARSAAKSRTW